MKTPRLQIARLIADKWQNKHLAESDIRQIAAFLISQHRGSELSSIMRDVRAARAEAGFVEVTASSAHPLNEAIIQTIIKQTKQQYPQSRHIKVQPKLEPALVGGVRLDLPGQRLDLSLGKKLQTFKQLGLNRKG